LFCCCSIFSEDTLSFIFPNPGITEQEFQELLDFLETAQLDRVGAFMYSPVEGAAANNLPDHISPEIQEERLARFMALQEKISADKLKQKIGKTLEVLVDEVDSEGAIARSHADAPEIDGLVYIDADQKTIRQGEFVKVRIVNSDQHDLWAELV